MKTRPVLGATMVADLRPVLAGWSDPVAVGVGPDGAIYAAARKSKENFAETRRNGTFPKSRLLQATDYLVARWQSGQAETPVIPGEQIAAHYVQPFPGGVLLAGARCHWRTDGAERNAIAVGWGGREIARFTLGDGIADLRVTRDGTIWASYFDEGVFGNRGWGEVGPAPVAPVGAAGLVAFLSTGEVCFSFDSSVAKTDIICDVYAMNLDTDGSVWVYFYTKFPIVRILDGTYRVWEPGIRGARALAVQEGRVLLVGDYNSSSLGRVLELGKNATVRLAGEVMLEDDRGEPLDNVVARGVGRDIYFIKERRVLVAEAW